MATDQFSLQWDNFHNNMSSGMQSLLESEDLVDVTLAVEGRHLKAHKMVLSVCSPYFRELFQSNPCQHPIVFMKDVSYIALSDLLQFMYQGEVQVAQENLSTFIKTAEALQIKGLTGDSHNQVEDPLETFEVEKPKSAAVQYKRTHEAASAETTPSVTRVKKSPAPIPKRPRYSRNSTNVISNAPVEDPIEVPEIQEVATASTTVEHLIQMKSEPGDVSVESMQVKGGDDSEVHDFMDDTLGDDDTEDYSLMEPTEDDPKPGTSADAVGDGQDIEEAATSEVPLVVPERSRAKYEQAYQRFGKWCEENKVENVTNEKFLLTYFEHLSKLYKSTSLWSFYSMLRTMISMKKNVDISKYKRLISFLKTNNEGYKPKKSKILSKQNIIEFLKKADDTKYLLLKVALIIGVSGGCRKEELTKLLFENVKDEGQVFHLVILNAKTKRPRDFFITSGLIDEVNMVDIVRKYRMLRPKNTEHGRFFVGYRYGSCTKQPVGINTFGKMAESIATFLKLPNPKDYTGNCFRRSCKSLLTTDSKPNPEFNVTIKLEVEDSY